MNLTTEERTRFDAEVARRAKQDAAVTEADRDAARKLKLKFLKARHAGNISVQEIAEAFAAHRQGTK
jgi:4-alpha-glucanotransferase